MLKKLTLPLSRPGCPDLDLLGPLDTAAWSALRHIYGPVLTATYARLRRRLVALERPQDAALAHLNLRRPRAAR